MHQDDTNAISLLLKSGLSHLNNNEIESAIQEFQLAEDIDPNNTEVLAIYILALSIDCEQNDRNCDNALKFFIESSPFSSFKLERYFRFSNCFKFSATLIFVESEAILFSEQDNVVKNIVAQIIAN